eukprot:1695046-Prymnesium_polylepis.1
MSRLGRAAATPWPAGRRPAQSPVRRLQKVSRLATSKEADAHASGGHSDAFQIRAQLAAAFTPLPEARFVVAKTGDDRGLGLFAGTSIGQHQFLFDYAGEVLDQHAYDLRYQAGHSTNEYVVGNRCRDGSMAYMDGTCHERSNLARYMNHSQEPNCELWTLNEPDLRWLLFTRSEVAMGDEL